MLKILDQPFSEFRLGDYLNGCFADPAWNRFNAAIAFVKRSGVGPIFDSISEFSQTKPVELLIGVDLQGTSIEGLDLLREAIKPNGQIHIVHSPGPTTFHPKLYCFRNDAKAEIAIGSGNLTAGGLYTNFEGVLTASLDLKLPDDRRFLNDIDKLLQSWRDHEADLSKELDDKLFDELEDCGLIVSESKIAQSISEKRRPDTGNGGKKRPSGDLFGSATISPAPKSKSDLPATTSGAAGAAGKTTTSSADISSHDFDKDTNARSLWIETRAMTGGSRNILDLSKHGMRQGKQKFGSVEYFGIDPNDESAEPTISIQYGGQIYHGNRILYAQANSNWRLQLKGATDTGDKLTAAVGFHGFVGKILTFKKTGPTHYELTILDADKLEDLKKSSVDWARGGTAGRGRSYGLI